MSRILFAIIIISWLASGCGNRRIISKNASKSVASKNYTTAKTNGSSETSHLTEEKTNSDNTENEKIHKETTQNRNPDQNNTYRYKRPRSNFQGASGIGTGGSYASNYYGSESAKSKKDSVEIEADNIGEQEYENPQFEPTLQERYSESQSEMDSDHRESDVSQNSDEFSSPQDEQTPADEYAW